MQLASLFSCEDRGVSILWWLVPLKSLFLGIPNLASIPPMLLHGQQYAYEVVMLASEPC
jgi:hypothetical protein